jgi:transposase
MSKNLGSLEIILVMDGAGWHKSKDLNVPWNIQIIYLPPYCPELNPVERLWNYIKSNTIKNRIYDNLKILEDTICEYIKNLNPAIIKSVCSFSH